jgi:hypothetical protein
MRRAVLLTFGIATALSLGSSVAAGRAECIIVETSGEDILPWNGRTGCHLRSWQ